MSRRELLEDTCKTALNRVPVESRMPFRWTVNPYRGCSHSCHYCFARAYHAYLDLGIGDDFSSKIVVKTNVVEVLRRELASPRWTGDHVAMGTATDPYQHCEGRYRLTRGVVEDLAYKGNRSIYRVRSQNGRMIMVSAQNKQRSAQLLLEWDDEVYLSWASDCSVVLTA